MIESGGARAHRRASALALPATMLLIGAAVAAGVTTAPVTSRPDPVVLRQDVPVVIEHSPRGAVAAADNYIAAEERALLSPPQLRRVITADWTPRAQPTERAQPFPAAALADKPTSFPGLQLTAAVAAHRLAAYSPGAAQVRVWDEVTVWSKTVTPTQRWSIDTITLVWTSGRWRVASRSTAPDAQTPVPSWTSGGPADRTSGAFDARLAGMTEPYYGATP